MDTIQLRSSRLEEVRNLLRARDWRALRRRLSEWPAPEVADLLPELEKPERVLVFRAVPREEMADVFSHLEAGWQDALLRELTDEETRRLLADLPPDDRTQLLEEMPDELTQRLLGLLSPTDLREARELLGYPEESVGRLMTPDYLAVRPEWTVEKALEHVRARGEESETVDVIYVTDPRGRMAGVLTMRLLLWADPDEVVREIMTRRVIQLAPTDDREQAVQTAERYDLFVLPVVGVDGVLLGIVTADDLLDVAEEEVTEDFHKAASVEPIRVSLREAGLGLLWRARIGWLLILVFINIFASAGIAHFEETIEAVVALVFFLPLLIDSGGNSGSQSATLVIRAMATGDVESRDWLQLLGKEVGVALLLGLSMAAAASLVALWRAPEVLLVVSAAMIAVVMFGSLVGILLPFILTRYGKDPATASAPVITSLADIGGVLIYFSIARWYLGI